MIAEQQHAETSSAISEGVDSEASAKTLGVSAEMCEVMVDIAEEGRG